MEGPRLRQLGFGTGIPRVGKSKPVPVPAETVPVQPRVRYSRVSGTVFFTKPAVILLPAGHYSRINIISHLIIIYIYNKLYCTERKTKKGGAGRGKAGGRYRGSVHEPASTWPTPRVPAPAPAGPPVHPLPALPLPVPSFAFAGDAAGTRMWWW